MSSYDNVKKIIAMTTLLLSSFTTDIKTIAIIVLLSVLIGVLLALRNFRGGGAAVVEDRSSDSSFLFFLLLILVAVVIYFYVANQPESMAPTPSRQENAPDNNDPLELERDEMEQAELPPIYDDWGTNMIINTHAIQVAAFGSLENGHTYASRLEMHEPIVIQEDGLYKLLIAGFPDRNSARQYQNEHSISGFVREFDYDTALVAVQ